MTLPSGSVGAPASASAAYSKPLNSTKSHSSAFQQSASPVTFASNDRYASTHAHAAQQSGKVTGLQASSSLLHFGSKKGTQNGSHFLRSTLATTLGVVSGIGLAIGIPLGLLQVAVGIIPIFHPLIYTGLLSMGLPALGLTLAWLLAPKNKGYSSNHQSSHPTPEEMV